MNKIIAINDLAPNVREYVIEAPDVALHAAAGQFVILRADADGERVPFTLCDMDKKAGTITLLIQAIGYTTTKMKDLKVGDFIHDVVGPLGNATDLSIYKKILLVGGGIGSAVIFPQAKYLFSNGVAVDVIVGAKTRELVMYEDEFRKNCDNLYIMTDDGSYGEKGFVTVKTRELLDSAAGYDCVMAVGPMMMMKAVCEVTKNYPVHTVVSMNSIMLDGTGMCGGCRLIVGGETKYACVDGPEFDGQLIDWNNALLRSGYYKEQEKAHMCRLTGEKHGN